MDSVTESTVSNCFRKAGFVPPLEPEVEEEDPFLNLNEENASQDDPLLQLEIENPLPSLLMTMLLSMMSYSVLPCQPPRTFYLPLGRLQKKLTRLMMLEIHCHLLRTSEPILPFKNCGRIAYIHLLQRIFIVF